MESLGFVRLFYSGEMSCSSGRCRREILQKRGNDAREFVEIDIPSELLNASSMQPEQRLSLRDEFTIVSAGSNIDFLKRFSQYAGWNQTESDLELLVSLDPRANFLASFRSERFDSPLGTGTVMPVADQLYWIGMILVHPQVRRQGIARKIMQHCIDYVRQHAPGAAIGLDATPEGFPLYERLGFKVITHLWRCRIDTVNVKTGISPARIDKIGQANEICDYAEDKKIPLRQELLTRLFELCPQGCFAASSAQDGAGFVMSRPGRVAPFIGPLFADDPDVARSLLGDACRVWVERGYDRAFIDVAEDHFLQKDHPENSDARMPSDHLLSGCIYPVRPFIRMILDSPAHDLADQSDFSRSLFATAGPEFG